MFIEDSINKSIEYVKKMAKRANLQVEFSDDANEELQSYKSQEIEFLKFSSKALAI